MTRQIFRTPIRKHVPKVGLHAPLSPRTLRHVFATRLLNHGADSRMAQLLLSHADISTKQIHTRVAHERR